jgi:hypothetical protein
MVGREPRNVVTGRSPWASSVAGSVLVVALLLSACTSRPGPGAGATRKSYPALSQNPTSYNWLILKCQLSDRPTIPSGLDTTVDQFFGLTGGGYGNIPDYVHDVSYNHALFLGQTLGWVRAPFSSADLSFPKGRLAPASARKQRVQECLQALPAQDLPDFDAIYGVAVVNNALQDGGACYLGRQSLAVGKQNHSLACVWFDPNSLQTEFAAHEVLHGLGLDHSFDDSGRNCGGSPGEYCDPWDIMSAQNTYQFVDRNFLIAGGNSGGGPGLNTPGLFRMGWMPSPNVRRFQFEGDEQQFSLRALSRPRGSEPLVVTVDVGSSDPFGGLYTVEYRQGDGWDEGFVTSQFSPAAVRQRGGTVLVHQFRAAGAPAARLVQGSFAGAMQPGDTLVLTGLFTLHVTVDKIDTTDGSATVSIGFGRGAPTRTSAVFKAKALDFPGLSATTTTLLP